MTEFVIPVLVILAISLLIWRVFKKAVFLAILFGVVAIAALIIFNLLK